MVTPINSGGRDGWWALNDVSVGPDTISATYRLNGVNKPRVSIDRHSGWVSIDGFSRYAFRGRCDTAGGPRRF